MSHEFSKETQVSQPFEFGTFCQRAIGKATPLSATNLFSHFCTTWNKSVVVFLSSKMPRNQYGIIKINPR